jgi:predicted PurR-regulated permease PerM
MSISGTKYGRKLARGVTMWINKPFFKYATGTILVLIIVYLFGKIDYFLWPFQKLIAAIFFPILVSGALYYLLRPLVNGLSRYIPKTGSILFIFLIIIGVVYAAVHNGSTVVNQQIQQMSQHLPEKVKQLSSESSSIIGRNNARFVSLEVAEQKLSGYLSGFSMKVSQNIVAIVQTIASIATVFVMIPFILFYFLRDGHKLGHYLLKFIPDEHEDEGNQILQEVDKTLSSYTIGQFIIAITDGALLFVGYLIIGLDNALIVSMFATCMTVVPFVGAIIGVVPALLMGFMQGTFMPLKVLIVLIIVQQLEGNLITPHIMGNRLNIHPLTIILILLISGSIYGFIGILISIPVYSVVKVIISNFLRFYKLRHGRKIE